jgi:hypothetical protein
MKKFYKTSHFILSGNLGGDLFNIKQEYLHTRLNWINENSYPNTVPKNLFSSDSCKNGWLILSLHEVRPYQIDCPFNGLPTVHAKNWETFVFEDAGGLYYFFLPACSKRCIRSENNG